jgi:hypothetical protein
MAAKRARRPKVGEKVRDKLTNRVGAVESIDEIDGLQQYAIAYDTAPQDDYLTTPGKGGAQRERHLLELDP